MLLMAQAAELESWLYNIWMVAKVLIGFSVIIFFHELGHFLAAKWVGIRVNQFAVGFGTRVVGYRAGEGVTFGNRPEYSADELARRQYGETDYCLRLLPIGGYVKMLGQDDVLIDEETGEMSLTDDPRAFPSRPVGQRMIVVSAGVIFNLLFAAALLTGVFLIGRTAEAPEIGFIPRDSAAYGKLETGDRVLEVNGRQVNSFKDVLVGSIIAGNSVSLTIERDGQRLPQPVVVENELVEEIGLKILKVDRRREPVLSQDVEGPDGQVAARKGDRIVAVNGTPLETFADLDVAFAASHGKPLELTVERPVAEDSDETITATCTQEPTLIFGSMRPSFSPEEPSNAENSQHLLGLARRQGINRILPGSAAEQAGFKPGDVIVQFGSVANPMYHEITEVVEASGGETPIAVRVQRGDRVESLEVTPRRRFQFFGQAKPKIGVEFLPEAASFVAGTIPETPAAELAIPRGARIVAVDNDEVSTWSEIAEALLARAGGEVTLKYVSGANIVGRPLRVPSSLVDQLGLTAVSRLEQINGEKNYETTNPFTGKPASYRLSGSSWAVREALSQYVGHTVEVTWRPRIDQDPITSEWRVTAEALDPWQMRLGYGAHGLSYQPKKIEITANGNPATALMMGVNEVKNWVLEVYAFLRGMLTRENVGVEHVSGPVGIVSVAVERAKAGVVELLYFIAFLSVNLAVINFLPIPVMDGGLMVFLLVEKIKGKPLSLQTQMISTLVGLAAILLLGLIVTFQDIGRLFQ